MFVVFRAVDTVVSETLRVSVAVLLSVGLYVTFITCCISGIEVGIVSAVEGAGDCLERVVVSCRITGKKRKLNVHHILHVIILGKEKGMRIL